MEASNCPRGVAVNVTDDEQKAGSSTVVKRRNSSEIHWGYEELPEEVGKVQANRYQLRNSVAALRLKQVASVRLWVVEGSA